MRSTPFSSVLSGVLTRMGLDPVNPGTNTVSLFAEYISSAARTASEIYPWPDFVRFENRQFYPSWAAGSSYAVNDVVLGSDGNYYYAKQANSSRNPTTDTTDTYWALASSYTSTTGSGILYAISLDQVLAGVTQTPIGEVIGVWQSDPRTNRYSTPVNWMLTNDGIVVGQNGLSVTSIPPTVWVEFTVRPSTYTSLSMTNGDTVPYVLAESIKASACASAYRQSGQFDVAAVMDAQARTLLDVEWDKLEMKQGQQGRFSAMTR